ncbi:TomO hydrophobic C-terminal domain-containing protein [Wolbachia pipientis]|uniref:TomO hydrophobic C-terminal domain-containing protein n=1 Tax=Wolbachia pipientis TaxID=955 RepID=UPI00202EC747|nr:hypothetical protein [Wolbachia pipientis]MCM1002560.1 hypothetical protein [Wolbachia pipientis]
MFRKVVQGFTNAATKPGCLGPFQRSLPQQEPASLNTYESNDRNVTGVSYRKNTTKVQQPETFSTQYIGASKFLFGKIQASESSGIAKPSLGGDVQFKKLRDIARLNPALCHNKSQPVGFGTSQQAVKNILAEGEKSDILSGMWGLMQNPISYSFREGEMGKEKAQGANKNQQLETPKSENEGLKDENQQLEALKSTNKKLEDENKELKTKLQEFENVQAQLANKEKKISELNGQVTKLIEEKNQLEENLNATKQSLNEKDKELKSKDEELKNETQQLETLKGENEKLKGKIQQLEALKSENEELKTKLQESEDRNKELEDNKDSKPSAINVQGVKSKVKYASASFILSGVCAVGASLATPYLAICATLAIAASVFLALGCHYLYKANTTLNNVKVDQPDNQRLLGSSL